MDNTILVKNNQLTISNSTETSSDEICNKPNVFIASFTTDLNEKGFEAILKNIKVEHFSNDYDEEYNDFEDSEGIIEKSTYNKDNKLDQQDEMCEVASQFNENQIINETGVDVSASNLKGFIKTDLFDSQITRTKKSYPSTAFPIMQIFSSSSTPHICEKFCAWCTTPFLVLDRPNHIEKIRNIDKQNEFLKMQPSLKIESCLCDLCWKFMEKTYRSIRAEQKKKISKPSVKFPVERYVKKSGPKNKSQSRRCSIHNCTKAYLHKMSVEQCENIKRLLLTFEYCSFVFIESKNIKKTEELIKFPLCVCWDHLLIIDIISTCQLCGDNLNEFFDADDWLMYESWNWTLITNQVPLILQPGMFICVTCKKHISKPDKFPTIDLDRFRQHINLKGDLRLKVYGPPQYNLFNICQGSTYVASPYVVPMTIKKEPDCLTKVTFSDPLLTATYHFEPDSDEDQSESITSTALKNIAKKNCCNLKLEPIHEKKIYPVKLEEENCDYQRSNLYTDQATNTSAMINSINQCVYIKPENTFSDQNSTENLNNNISNGTFNDFTYGTTDYVFNTVMDDNKWHLDRKLLEYHREMSKNKEIKKPNASEVTSIYSLRKPRRDNKLGRKRKELEKEVVNSVPLKKRKNGFQSRSMANVREMLRLTLKGIKARKSLQQKRNNLRKNLPSILNKIPNYGNYLLSSNFIDVQGQSTDLDEQRPYSGSMKDIELNMNEPSICIEKTYRNPNGRGPNSLH